VFRSCEEIRRITDSGIPEGRRLDHIDEVPQLLLRIYDECDTIQERGLQQQCLDSWDIFLGTGHRTARSQAAEFTATS